MTVAARRALNHLLGTTTDLHAWFRLGEVHWAFREHNEQESAAVQSARAWAALAGLEVHLRQTTRPLSAQQWAADLDTNTNLPPFRKDTWREGWLKPQTAALEGLRMANEETYLGIRVGSDLAGSIVGSALPGGDRLRRKVARISELAAAKGLDGRPVTVAERDWLLQRSHRLGLPDAPLRQPSRGLGPDGLQAFAEGIKHEPSPFGNRLLLKAPDGEAHVAILTLAQWSGVEVPGDLEPWLHYAGQLEFPVEWSIRGRVLAGAATRGKVWQRLRMVRAQQRDYHRIGLDVPEDVEELIPRARAVDKETKTGAPWMANRFHGWVHVAVAAEDSTTLEERVDGLIDHYDRLDWRFVQTRVGQAALARSFVPCEPMKVKTYVRRGPVRMLAAGMPTIASQVGDPSGPRFGVVWGTDKKPVLHDPHRFMDRAVDASSLNLICGGLGAGKSGALVQLCIPAVLRGASGVLFDPSGPLKYVTQHPLLAGDAEHLSLIDGEPGSLSPYRVIPDPRREDYSDDDAWRHAVLVAGTRRIDLAVDVLRMALSTDMNREPLTEPCLRRAARRVGGTADRSLMDVIDELLRDGDVMNEKIAPDWSRILSITLRDIAEVGHSPLMFAPPPATPRADKRLTVVTMQGLQLPKPGDLLVTTEQRLSLPLLHLGIHLATRLLYDRPKSEPKFFGADECHFLERFASGVNLAQTLITDGRKWGISVNLATQAPRVFKGLQLDPFIETVMVGRLSGKGPQAEAAELLGLQPSDGLGDLIGNLSEDKTLPREFLYRDRRGHVDLLRVDMTADPDSLALIQKDVWAKDGARR